MLAPLVLLSLTSLAPAQSAARSGVSYGVSADYGLSFMYRQATCIIAGPCGDAHASGPGVSLAATLLFGEWLQGGARLSGAFFAMDGVGGAGSLMAVGRLGRALYVDLGAGLGYAFAHRSSQLSDGLGVAAALQAGYHLGSELAVVARAEAVVAEPGALMFSAGVEWRP